MPRTRSLWGIAGAASRGRTRKSIAFLGKNRKHEDQTMSFPPDAFLIGAEKCGTTTLTDLLAQHPSLVVSEPRDSDFFTRNYGKGFDWYRSLFPGPEGRVCLDVSLSYSSAPLTKLHAGVASCEDPTLGVPKRIHSANPRARFIYVLRNPVTRTYSAYWHAVRYGYRDIGFRRALGESPRFLDNSDYAGQIGQYLEYFPIEAFHFIVFEEMTADPVAAAMDCYRHLGLESQGFIPSFERPKNESFRYNAVGRALRAISPSGAAMNRIVNLGQALTPRFLEPWARRLIVTGIPPIDAESRQFLDEYFEEKNQALARLTGLTLERWHA